MSTSPIDSLFETKFKHSRELWERFRKSTPGGVTHYARMLSPFPLFIDWNRGVLKGDVDGNEFIDYWLGHGSNIIGHAHPEVVEAITKAAVNGGHAGGESLLAIEWAELIKDLVPSIEHLRFVASGGEATALALRVARAFTGKDKIVKFDGAFHGWHDGVALAVFPPYDVPLSPGIPKGTLESILHVPYNDLAAVSNLLSQRQDIAAVIVEPGGAFNDNIPSDPQFIKGLREVTKKHSVLLICDEVVTGFRYSRAGAQGHFGITPDLTTLGKVVSGGVPAGVLGGRADVMEVLMPKPDPEWMRYKMVPLPGTWNAMPLAAAAGVATLKILKTTDALETATGQCQKLIAELNRRFKKLSFEAYAYGRGSIFRTRLGQRPKMVDGDFSKCKTEEVQILSGWGPIGPVLRKSLLLEGVDVMRTDGFLSSIHTDQHIHDTCDAYENAIKRLLELGLLTGNSN